MSTASRFPGFSLRPSRALWGFLVGAPAVAVAALNTGNNALYLLLSLSLGAFAASGLLSRYTLARLEVRVEAPREVFAAAPVRFSVEIGNLSSWLPAAGVVCRVVGSTGGELVPTIPPGERRRVTLVAILPRRGLRRFPGVRAEVRLPLGFFAKSVLAPSCGDVVVYPRMFPGAAPRWSGTEAGDADLAVPIRRRGGEIHQLRQFRTGDDVRDIHWKQTARQRELVVVERRDRAAPARLLVLDREVARPADPQLLERFEDLVSEVASAALERLGIGEAVGLVIGGSLTPPSVGSEHATRLLTALATVEAVGVGEDPVPDDVAGESVYALAGRP